MGGMTLTRHANVCVKVVKDAEEIPDEEASSQEVTVIQWSAAAGCPGGISNTQVAAQWTMRTIFKYYMSI